MRKIISIAQLETGNAFLCFGCVMGMGIVSMVAMRQSFAVCYFVLIDLFLLLLLTYNCSSLEML